MDRCDDICNAKLLHPAFQAVCEKLSFPEEGKQLLTSLAEAANIYFNYTGESDCLNTSQQATVNLGDLGWSYQAGLFIHKPVKFEEGT